MSKEIFEKIKEQEDVLNSHNKNIVVSASAGSGKTSVMIRKIASAIIDENVHVSELLVLTYTNAAASEMKQKLLNYLGELTSSNSKLINEIEDINLSDISTVDSFCQKIVKKYFYILNIDPGFSIIKSSEQKQIQLKALKKALSIYKQNSKEKYFKIFDIYAKNRTDNNIVNMIMKFYNYSCSILNYEEWKKISMELFENEKAGKILLKNTTEILLEIKKEFENLLKKCKNLALDKYCEYINTIISTIDVIQKIQNWGDLIDYVNDMQLSNIVKKEENDDNIREQIAILKDMLNKIFVNIKVYGSKQIYIDSNLACKQITEIIFEICDEFIRQYEKIKKQKNVYDYNDVERLTIKLFENNDILETIKNSYKKIFIDEFQDANLVQEKIITSLQNGNNLFFVGDLKQAIYGFRQSNSKIFQKTCEKFEHDYKETGNSQSLYLNCNFRTTQKVLEFINKIFSVIMTDATAGLNYKEKAQLKPKAKYEQEKGCSVELDILYTENAISSKSQEVYSVMESSISSKISLTKQEANFVAEKITKLLNEKIYDVKINAYRNVKYNDIAILFRTRANQNEFVSTLNNYNIPTIQNSNINLEQSYDVMVLINLIKIALNFNDDYALSSIMMSNLFEFDANEMMQIRENTNTVNFYDCVKNYKKDDKLQQKILKMQNVIDKFYEIMTFDGISKALIYVVDEQKYEYKLSLFANGYDRIKNVKDFISSFNNSNFNNSPSEYVNFIKETTREQKVVGQVSSQEVVTLTTMHASKGLEWPIVIIPNLGANFNKKPNESEIALNEELGVGLKYYNQLTREKHESVYYDVVKNKNKDSEFSEKIRLFYVALTRAKNRLVLLGSKETLNFYKYRFNNQIKSTQCYLDFLVNSLNVNDIEKANNKITFNIFNDESYVCNLINADLYNAKNFNAINSIYQNKTDDKITQKLSDYINRQYFNLAATQKAQKSSVSKIMQEEQYVSYNTAPKSLEIKEHLNEFDKDEIGNMYHKIFENFQPNSSNLDKGIQDAIIKTKQQELFDDDMLESIDYDILKKNATIINAMTKNAVVLKEHSFIMYIPYSEIEESDIQESVLIQGICDLIIIKGEEAILVDYKYSNLSENSLIKKYQKQLELYKKAIEYGLGKKVDKAYILSIKNANLIKCNAN